jgi:hypothetical protein
MAKQQSKIYPGMTGWCNFKPGNHNWLDDNRRTFLNLDWCSKKGKHSYQPLFLNTHYADGTKNPHLDVEQTETHVILKIAKQPSVKLFSIGGKDMFE